jgi:hypothetical protein
VRGAEAIWGGERAASKYARKKRAETAEA